MTYRQIFDSEKRITIQELYEIRFYKEGLWWKAWEWSVYLYFNFFSDVLEERYGKKVLNLLKKETVQNKEGNIVIVGFPIEAFDNYLTNSEDFCVLEEDDEIVFDLSKDVSIKEMIDSKINLDNYEEILVDWKDGQPFTDVSEKVKKKKEYKGNICVGSIYEDVIEKILNYPIENKTLLENTQFLAELKEFVRNNL